MKRFVFAATLFALLGAPSFAALPPNYQRLVELRAVLDAIQPLIEEIGEVTAIEFIAFDLYEVRSDRCRVAAHIVDVALEPGFVGPRQFTVTLGKIACAAP
jgi:hypothetical protein